MKLDNKGKEFIKGFEGCSLVAYKVLDSEKYYTIGYGHYGSDVYEGMKITKEQADLYFEQDIYKYENAVNNFKFSWKLNQNEFNALVSFCYNLGVNILNDFNGLTREQIVNEIPLYCNSGGVRLEGLVRRRREEVKMFNTPINNINECIEYSEIGVFYPNDKIYFRSKPIVSFDNIILGYYSSGEFVYYDRVYKGNDYVWISWIGSTSGERRYMPIRTYKNGVYGEIWGIIK